MSDNQRGVSDNRTMAGRIGPMDLNERQGRLLAVIQREFAAAHAARVGALVRAQIAVMSGSLTVGQVAFILGIGRGTWHRWVRDFGLRELAADCVLEVDQALRGAGVHDLSTPQGGASDDTTVDEVKADPNLQLALGSIGVWRKS